MHRVRARQREEYGGINWGAAFFGWLVAVGVAVLLTGILAAAGAAIGLTETTSNAADAPRPRRCRSAGAIALLVVLAIAYYCGGYVAGPHVALRRRAPGHRRVGVGLLITLAARRARRRRRLPVQRASNAPTCRACPSATETLTTGGAIASLVILAGTLLSAALGGIAGARYHRKVDRAGFPE